MEAERAVYSADYWAEADDEETTDWSTPASTAVRELYPVPTESEQVLLVSERDHYADRWKRGIDLLLGIPLFLASLPLIGLAIAIVALTSGWPVFYKTKRVGAAGREFNMWKIRSMVKDADAVLAAWRTTNPNLASEYDANFKLKDDPRVTAIGRVIRRTSIDELPQFWNVLRGDMSLVGPRPYFNWELALHPVAAETIVRLRPGVTGPWQVAGRNSLSPAERMFIDRAYVNTCSLSNDLQLLASTVAALLKPNGI